MKNLDTVYQHIRRKIETKQLFPGHKIIEESLAQELGLSRSSVRSALAKLEYEGFVDIFPNKGAYIIKPTYSEIDNLYKARLQLEIGAFREAIINIQPHQLVKLDELMQKQVDLMGHFSITEYAILNRLFHEEIVKASGNPYYEKFLKEIYNRTHILLIFYDSSRNNAGSLQTHMRMIEALKNNDLEAGIEAVKADNLIGFRDLDLPKNY